MVVGFGLSKDLQLKPTDIKGGTLFAFDHKIADFNRCSPTPPFLVLRYPVSWRPFPTLAARTAAFGAGCSRIAAARASPLGERDERNVLRSSLGPWIRAGVRNKQPIRLVEESRLSRCLIAIAKVAKPNAN